MSFQIERRHDNTQLRASLRVSTVDFATTADLLQESAAVDRLPEVTYGRFGDRVGPFTTSTQVRFGLLAFDSYEGQLEDFGFTAAVPAVGIPSFGFTDLDQSAVPRADLRHEIAAPFDVGALRFVPFVVGRVTAYGDSPAQSSIARGLGGIGMRVGTAFAKVDDSVYSRLLDLDRMRHVIEPSVSGFFGVTNNGRENVFIYDEDVDGWDELSAVSGTLRQRWQTYRGAPGRQRSVDVFTLTSTINWFGREPEEPTGLADGGITSADDFRGLYYDAIPEASLARDNIDSDALWRVSDSVALVGQA
ncbi:MAG: hypothetical protein AAGK78_16985, partial [Planctomycetota bacterium]